MLPIWNDELKRIQLGVFPQQVLVHIFISSTEYIHVLLIWRRSGKLDNRARPVRLDIEPLLAAKIEGSFTLIKAHITSFVIITHDVITQQKILLLENTYTYDS